MNRIFVLGVAVVMIGLAIASFAYTVEKCGLGKAVLFGKNGFWIAATGTCD